MGLGSIHDTSLAEAREAVRNAHNKIKRCIDPLVEKRAERAYNRAERAKRESIPTLLECADRFIAAKSGEWTNAKHVGEWRRTFHRQGSATVKLNDLPVNAIDTPLILAALDALSKRRPITAGRVAQRIAAVLDFAKAHGWRSGDNPAAHDCPQVWDVYRTRGRETSRRAEI
jgi:hypothetical protein